MNIKPRARYTEGKPAWQGDKITVIATGEPAYLRVIGEDGKHVTIYHSSWDTPRVCLISEIQRRA